MAGLDQDGDAPTGAWKDGPAPREVAAKSLKCPSCGAPWTLRGFANTQTVACASCGSILDTTTTEWQIVEKVERRRHTAPLWPLGQRGKFEGKTFELVGWMWRSVRVEGETFRWEEHLFFNPYYGYRYLVYQDGHFQLVEPLPGMPEKHALHATYDGNDYRHFSTASAVVDEVIGEFPWRVTTRKEARVRASDYVAPPLMLSSEESDGDVVWSRGTYMTEAEVVAAVTVPKRPVAHPADVYPNQPNPYDKYLWLRWAFPLALVGWCLLTVAYLGRAQEKTVLDVQVPPKAAATPAPAPVPGASPTPAPPPPGSTTYEVVLDSRRDPATVEVQASALLSNTWAYCDCALVDTVHEHAYPFGVEVSYYEGVDDGESWSEGSRSETLDLGGIPNGKYVLQVERGDDAPVPVHLVIKRDVSLFRYPCCSFLLFALFPLVVLFLRSRFESRRWAQSDHAPGSS